MMNKLPEIPKHLQFAHVLVLCKDESTYGEAVFGHDGCFRWGYDEPVIEDVEAWLPLPTRATASQEPVGEVSDMKYNLVRFYRATGDTSKPYLQPGTKLYTAPVSVALPTREEMADLVGETIGGDTYDCTRVWSAWGVGTMSEDDFVPISQERLYEMADAYINRLKELNQ